MITQFTIVSATTVPSPYYWDIGTPLQTDPTLINAFTTENYVSGYAPAVNVRFRNVSETDPQFSLISYDWDFGDYYHDTNNKVSLPCVSEIEHLYIMPGIYTVSLRHRQTRTTQILEIDPLRCRGKYDVRWFWQELERSNETRRTWDETSCTYLSSVDIKRWTPKWWDDESECFQKYCKFWSWYNLTNLPARTNPIIWNDTGSDDIFEKKWMFEDNETQCRVDDFGYRDVVEVNEQFAIKVGVVEVKEILPTAGITCITQPITGITPLTVQLSPSACRPGSFPLDRIDWDFGDGSPIKTITRFTDNSNDPELIYTDCFFADPADVRNYNVTHTYVRTADTYSVFYPSLTCYSSNTGTSDSCCTTIGPIKLVEAPDLELVKVRNTLKGNVYAFNVNRNITFHTNSQTVEIPEVAPNEPTAPLRNSSNQNRFYFGYQGTDFPPEYIPDCEISIRLPDIYLTTEDDDPFDGDTNVDEDELGLALTTEGGQPLIP
jgi:hypothetical protein